MPINEPAAGRRGRGGLTKQQKKEAEASLYGLGHQEKIPVSDNPQYSPSDIEQMRQIVLQNDISTGKVLEFDLNKPTTPPYVHQDFPRIVYHHKSGAAKKVADDKELQEALAKGYSKDPPAPPPAEGDEDQADAENPAGQQAQMGGAHEPALLAEQHRGGRRK